MSVLRGILFYIYKAKHPKSQDFYVAELRSSDNQEEMVHSGAEFVDSDSDFEDDIPKQKTRKGTNKSYYYYYYYQF